MASDPRGKGRSIAVWMFKVQDYTTVLVGTKEPGRYVVERGDGTKYYYGTDEVVWSRYLGRFEV